MAKNRTELVAEVAEKSGKSQATVNAVLDAVFQVFESSVSKGEKITIPGWMAIERTDRAARTGRNPQTGETIQIPAGHGVKLTAGSKKGTETHECAAVQQRSTSKKNGSHGSRFLLSVWCEWGMLIRKRKIEKFSKQE